MPVVERSPLRHHTYMRSSDLPQRRRGRRMTQRIGLVAEAKQRRGGIRQAREQFDRSPVFRRARDYCERTYGEWYILSADHHVLAPHQVVGPGGNHVHTFSAEDRFQWAERVATRLYEMNRQRGGSLSFVLFASQRYADLVLRAAPDLTLELPLSGMGLRDRIRWFDDQLQIRPRLLGARAHANLTE